MFNYGKIVDGHCPGLSGEDLETYITNGKRDGVARITSDHQICSFKEAVEKAGKGMYVAMRYGSAEKELAPLGGRWRRSGRRPNFCINEKKIKKWQLEKQLAEKQQALRRADVQREEYRQRLQLADVSALREKNQCFLNYLIQQWLRPAARP